MAIGNTGVARPTKMAVSDVRKGWEIDQAQYEAWFDQIGAIVQQARSAIETGAIEQLGPLMDQNQALLRDIQVSGPSRTLDLGGERPGAGVLNWWAVDAAAT